MIHLKYKTGATKSWSSRPMALLRHDKIPEESHVDHPTRQA
jgi:hypothetical protein